MMNLRVIGRISFGLFIFISEGCFLLSLTSLPLRVAGLTMLTWINRLADCAIYKQQFCLNIFSCCKKANTKNIGIKRQILYICSFKLNNPYWKKWCFKRSKWHTFSTERDMHSALKVTRFQPNFAIFFTHFFQHWKWNAFSLISPYFSCVFFTNCENAIKFKFTHETVNILRILKFTGSHLVFYDWKVSFSLISPGTR
jgi:hypothetical protein